MKVVLIKNDPKLGEIGEVKEVAVGFARNCLIPNKIAKLATEVEIEKAQALQKKQKTKKKKVKINAASLAESLQGYKLIMMSKADENGTFFAGITADKIAEQLSKEKLQVKTKQIKLTEPIKKAGSYNVSIKVNDKVVQVDLEAKAE